MAKRGGFPGGMPGNMNNLMKQAQKMQKQMMEAQEQMANSEYTAKAGGGAVEVTVTGLKEVKSIKIDKEVVDPDDVEMLEDLIMAAMIRDSYTAIIWLKKRIWMRWNTLLIFRRICRKPSEER